MRSPVLFLFVALCACLNPVTTYAGRLDVAVIQFTDARTPEDLAAGLAGVNLFDITDSDRTETNVKELRGGHVVFVQSFHVSPGSKFATATRIGSDRADVSGSLAGSTLSIEIAIQKGVSVGLRKFTRNIFSGSGSVAGGSPQIIGIKASQGKTQSAIKGSAKIETYNYTSLIAAQYTP